MKSDKLKKILLILGGSAILLGAAVVYADPGSSNDPLVSLSYLDKRLDELKNQLEKKIDKAIDDNSNNNDSGTTNSNEFKVVVLSAGQTLIGKGGTEIILRGGTSTSKQPGKAVIRSNVADGLSDITDGKDLKDGVTVPLNHLLIVPRDGRGVQAINDSTFLIKGDYEVK